jgi:hypothetical protein
MIKYFFGLNFIIRLVHGLVGFMVWLGSWFGWVHGLVGFMVWLGSWFGSWFMVHGLVHGLWFMVYGSSS